MKQKPDFDSRDCVNVAFEAVGDRTVRPLRPQLRQLALAERDRLARLQDQINEYRRDEQPTDTPSPKNGSC